VAGNVIHDHPFGFGVQVYDVGLRAIVVNNTITHNGWSGVVAGGSGVWGVVIRNNILAFNAQHGIEWDTSCPNDTNGTTIAEHNVLFGNVRGPIVPSSCTAVSEGAGNRDSDPLFANAEARDFLLTPGSSALGYALPLWALAPDAGAPPPG